MFSKHQRFVIAGMIFIYIIIQCVNMDFRLDNEVQISQEPFEYEYAMDLLDQPASLHYQNQKTRKVRNSEIQDTNWHILKMERHDWKLLGFKIYVHDNIQKFIQAGGQIKNANDLTRIYGIDSSLVQQYAGRFIFPSPSNEPSRKINVNTADTIELRRLYGIGPKLSKRIYKYRSNLGGFHNKEQLLEVYGISREVLDNNKEIIECEGPLKKMNINTISQDSLRRHYYFDWKLSSHIINYRQLHGPFKEVALIKEIKTVDDSIFKKIMPYLSCYDNF